jgi:hypothetical protein
MRVKAESKAGQVVRRASGKPVWTWPPVVAADAGLMQIQLGEGTVLRCAEAVLKGTTPRVARLGNWLGGKSSAKRVVEEPGGKDLFGGKVQRCEARRSTRSFGVGDSLFMPQR